MSSPLMSPLPEGETSQFVYARRKKSKGGAPRFYLYEQTCENQILSAQGHFFLDYYYAISLSSTNFDFKSDFFLGKLSVDVKHAKFFVYPMENTILATDPTFEIQIKPDLVKQIALKTQKLDTSLVRSVAHDNIARHFPDVEYISSEKNILLEYQDQHLFSFSKTSEDEAHVAISHPLSIFDGFCLALTVSKRFGSK